MSSNRLEEYLKSLHQAAGKQSFVEAKRIVKYIAAIVKEDKSELEAQHIIAKLFSTDDNENDIVTILEKIVLNSKFMDTNREIMNIMLITINKHASYMQENIRLVIDICKEIFGRTRSAYVKSGVLNLLAAIFSKQWAKRLNVNQVFERVFGLNKLPSKVFVSMCRFGSAILQHQKIDGRLRNNGFEQMIKSLMENTPHRISLVTFAFANNARHLFECIVSYLTKYPTVPSDILLRQLYNCCKFWVSPKHGRLTTSTGALKLIITHTRLFETFLLQNYRYWHWQLLFEWKNLTNYYRAARNRAMPILYSFYARTSKSNDVFHYFSLYFSYALQAIDLNDEENRIALFGLSHFVGTNRGMYVVRLSEIVDEAITKLKLVYLSENEPNWQHLQMLPDLLNAIVQLSCCIETDDDKVITMKNLTILMIREFSKINNKVPKTFCSISAKLLEKSGEYYEIIRQIIYESLIWTCSRPIVTEENVEIITYKDYMEFWRDIIAKDSNDFVNLRGIFSTCILFANIQIIDKIDLNVYKLSETNILTAKSVNDMNIFYNIVNFLIDVIELIPKEVINAHANEILNFLIKKSYENPLVNGYLKLIGQFLDVSNDLNAEDCIYIDFFHNTMSRAQYYKDELLLSIVQMSMKMPLNLVKRLEFDEILTQTIISAFEIGKILSDVVESAVDTIQKWSSVMSTEGYAKLITAIIPLLHDFLRYNRSLNQLGLQKKIMVILGSLNDDLLTFTHIDNSSYLAKTQINFDIRVKDIKIKIELHQLVEHVTQLSLNGDHQLRIPACELLHTLVILFLGLKKQQAIDHSDENTFKYLTPVLFELSTHADHVVAQIFESLTLQIVRWQCIQTNQSLETNVIVDYIFDAICNRFNSRLRDFSAKCLQEYCKWTIKCNNKSCDFLDAIVQKIIAYSVHAEPKKRFGACLGFNQLYRILREDDRVIETFWIKLFTSFVMSFQMINEFYDIPNTMDLNAKDHTSLTLDHLMRVFLAKVPLFMKSNERNILETNHIVNYHHLTEWVLSHSNDDISLKTKPNAFNCNEKCLQMFELFLNATPDKNQLKRDLITANAIVKLFVNNLKDSDGNGLEWIKATYSTLNFINCMQTNDLLSSIKQQHFDKILARIEYFAGNLNSFTSCDSLRHRIFDWYKKKLAEKIIQFAQRNINFIDSVPFDSFANLSVYYLFETNQLNLSNNTDLSLKNPHRKTALLCSIEKYLNGQYHNLQQFQNIDNVKVEKLNRLVKFSETDLFNEVTAANSMWKNSQVLQTNLLNAVAHSHNTQAMLKFGREILKLSFKCDQQKTLINLLECIDNQSEIIHPTSKKLVKIGSVFLAMFNDVIYDYLLQPLNLKYVLQRPQLFNSVKIFELLAVKRMRKSESRFIVLDVVLTCWRGYLEYFQRHTSRNVQKYLDNLIKLVLAAIPEENRIITVDENDAFFIWVIDRLKFSSETLNADIFDFIPYVKSDSEHLWVAIDNFLEKITIEALACDDHSRTIRKVIESICKFTRIMQTKRTVYFLLHILLKNRANMTIFTESCVKTIMPRVIIPADQSKIINLFYNTCTDNHFARTHRLNIIEIFQAVFVTCQRETCEKFYIQHLHEILRTLKKPWNFDDDVIFDRILAFITIDMMFFMDCNTHTVEKFVFAMTNSEKILDKAVSKLVIDEMLNCRIGDHPSAELVDLTSSYYTTVYKTCVSLFCHTQQDPEKYYCLFMAGSVFKNKVFWMKFHNGQFIHVNYSMTSANAPTKTRQHLLNVRSRLKPSQINERNETQTLFSSTLKEDVTLFDFSNADINTQTHNLFSVHLEVNDINDHVLMPVICALMQHIVHLDHSRSNASNSTPKWIKAFLKILADSDTAKNCKLFLLQVIINLQHLLHNYSKCFAKMIIECLIDENLFEDYNDLVIELIWIVIDWKIDKINTTPFLQQTEIVEKFMNFFINSSETCNRMYYLQAFEALVNLWREQIQLTTGMFDYFKHLIDDPDKIHIQTLLMTIFLTNNLKIWANNLGKGEIYAILRQYCTFSNRNIYQPATEACALILKQLDNGDNDLFDEQIIEALNQQMQTSVNDSTKIKKLFVQVDRIASIYPKMISERMFIFLLRCINANSDEHLAIVRFVSLREIFSNLTRLVSIYHANLIELDDYVILLDSSDSEVTIAILHFIHVAWPYLSMNKQRYFFEHLNSLVDHKSKNVREIVYKIMKTIVESNICVTEAENILLHGVSDCEQSIRQLCLEFSMSRFESSNPIDQIFQMISTNNRVSTAIECVLELAKNNEKIFNYPLAQCVYIDHEINVNSSTLRQSQIYTPMFVETLNTNSTLLIKSNFQPTLLSFEETVNVNMPNETIRETILGTLPFSVTEIQQTMIENETDIDNVMHSYRSERRRTIGANQRQTSYARLYSKKNQKGAPIHKNVSNKQLEFCRKYRTGDYPDIDITNKCVIELLQRVSRLDPFVSRILLASLCRGLVHDDQYLTNLERLIENMLSKAINNDSLDSHRNACAFEMAIEHAQNLSIDPKVITKRCIETNHQALGILLLEKIIRNERAKNREREALESLNKRPKFQNTSLENNWLQLAVLYRELSDDDVFFGIYREKIDNVHLHNAIELQAEQNYAQAFLEYSTAFSGCTDRTHLDLATLECYRNLGNWSEVNESLTKRNFERAIIRGDTLTSFAVWLESGLMAYLTGEDDSIIKRIMTNLTTWFRTKPELEVVFKKHFSTSALLLALIDSKKDLANHMLELMTQTFLNQWHQSNVFNHDKYLITLKTVAWMNQLFDLDCNMKIQKFYEQCFKMHYSQFSSFFHMETIVAYSKEIINQLPHPSDPDFWRPALFHMNKQLMHCAGNLGKFLVIEKYMRQNLSKATPSEKFELELDLCGFMEMKASKIELASESCNLLSQAWQNLLDLIPTNAEQEILHKKRLCLLVKSFVTLQLSSHRLPIASGFDFNLNSLIKQQTSLLELIQRQNGSIAELGHAYFQLSESAAQSDNTQLLVRSLLDAIKYQCEQAQLIFPSLFQLEQFDEHLTKISCEKIQSIADAAFVMWIPQLVSQLDTKHFAIVAPIISRLAISHPALLRYPFGVRKSLYKPTNAAQGHLIDEISRRLFGSEQYEKFVECLQYVAQPEHILGGYIKTMRILLEQEKNIEASSVHRKIEQVLYNSRRSGVYYGKQMIIIRKYKESLEKIAIRMSNGDRTVVDQLKAIEKELLESVSNREYSSNLHDYSPFLAEFHMNRNDIVIELPSYNGIYIVSLENQITPIRSLRVPLKIVIVASNGQKYRFLVKYGEDLRLDERVQQAFCIGNRVLQANVEWKNMQAYNMQTYRVIAITNTFGMIEWLEDTLTLRHLMPMANDVVLTNNYQQWVNANSLTTQQAYVNMFKNYKPHQVVANFEKLMEQNALDSFTKSFRGLSLTLDHFFQMRSNFIGSYALMCLNVWLLGIGDRHLSNTLINAKNGACVAIDFAYAFSFATEHLPVPELVPFRLTPQIMQLMSPLKTTGTFKCTMIRCLNIFRKSKRTLLVTVESSLNDSTLNGGEKYREKLHEIALKLNGGHPITLMVNLLRKNPHISGDSKYFADVILDCSNVNYQFKHINLDNLSVHQQIECLICVASDFNILGRSWCGWRAWL